MIDWVTEHQGSSSEWVSDHPPTFVYEILRLTDLPRRPRCRILEVGVGMTGASIRQLAMHHEMVAVDIVPVALAKVADVAETRLIGDLQGIAPVDVAFAHLVVQHCNNAQAHELVRNVVSVLKPTARFLLQYADDIGADTHCVVPEPYVYVRTPAEMHRVIEDSGGRVVEEWDAGVYPAFGVRWHVAAIMGRR